MTLDREPCPPFDLAWAAHTAERTLTSVGSRWAHTLAVAQRASELSRVLPTPEGPVLIAAGYLHDVGYAPELAVTGFHPLDGARWLRAQGHHRLAGLVAHHTGARYEAETRGLSVELDEFAFERSAVADLLVLCDLTTDPVGNRVTPSVRLAEIDARHGSASEVSRSLRAATPELMAAVYRARTLLRSSAQ